MSKESDGGLHEELERLRLANAELQRKVLALADANAYAAELLAALEEAQEREAKLVRRGEELDLQTRLDLVMQRELIESRLIEQVAKELVSTASLGARGYEISWLPETIEAQRGKLSVGGVSSGETRGGEQGSVRGKFSIPICISERVVGRIDLEVGETDSRWTERWERFLCSVGNQLGMSLQRLRVEHENERMNTELIVARDQALEASRAKTVFLANMSHELRTPMNAILGYSEMLIEDVGAMSAEEIASDLSKIRNAGKHLLALINDVLDLSKIESGKMTMHHESFLIEELVQDIVSTMEPIASKNGNRIEVRCPKDLGAMFSDSMKVRQCLMNLLSNACKFSENSTIDLSLSTRTHEGEEYVLFAVSDHGIGMSTEQIAKLFQAFVQADDSTTRKYGGTGLGLTISRRLCEMLGGDIRVCSDLGHGSTFTMELPRNVRSTPTVTSAVSSVAVQDSVLSPVIRGDALRGTVLAIDDNPDALDLISRSLSKEGYRVIMATSGESGLVLARAHKPDIITLDVMMPQMNGWQVLAAIKADPSLAMTPVVLLSVVENNEIAMALGATDCLTKPIDWTKLQICLERLLPKSDPDRILVVEDDPASSELVTRILERDGWKIERVCNGKEAYASMEVSAPALVLLDLMMPEMDGFELVSKLRDHPTLSMVPVVVLTSKMLTPEDHARLNGGVLDILAKGTTGRSDLLEAVRKVQRRVEVR
jgi:signal transduction histidine kinase/CheY-like chemotaxis protein